MIKITGLNKFFNKNRSNEIHVINDSSIEFPKTGLVTIYGESGCGKTTLLNVLGGLDDFYSGTIEIDEVKIKKYKSKTIDKIRNEKIGFIFQNYLLLQQRTVFENLKIILDMYEISKEEINERIDYVLQAVGMLKYKKKNVSELSGGQQQRVAIARALIKSPSLILADEPTGNLDEKNTIEVMNILKKISKNTLIILVSHEQNIVNSYSDYINEIKDGKIVNQKDVVNQDKYEYKDDQNIYLKEYEYKNISNDSINIDLYNNENAKIDLKIVYKNNKFFITSSRDVILLDNSSEIKLVDDYKKEIDTVSIVDENNFELNKLEYKKNPRLSFKDILKISKQNIKTLKARTISLSISLFIISILVLLTVHSLIVGGKVDFKTITKSHSEIYNITIQKGNVDVNYNMQKLGFKVFYEDFVRNNPNIDIVVEDKSSMKYTLNTFTQFAEEKYTFEGFSLLNTEQIPDKKLYCGRLPEKSREIVVEKWVLEKKLVDSTLANFMTVKSFVGEKVRIGSVNFDFTIVGIADNDEHAIYINKWHMFDIMTSWFSIQNISVGSLTELSKYIDTSSYDLSGKKCLWTSVRAVPSYNNQIIVSDDGSATYDLHSVVDFKGAPFDMIVDESEYNTLLSLILVRNYEQLNLLCNEEERKQVDEYLQMIEAKFSSGEIKYNDTKEVKLLFSAESEYDNLVKQHIENADKVVKSRLLITICIVVISICIVLFSMKSYAMKNIYDIGVYRAIGVRKSSVVLIYALETLIISLKTTLFGGILCYVVTNIIGSIPVLEGRFAISFELFIAIVVALILINILVGILPIMTYLRLTPFSILTKNER